MDHAAGARIPSREGEEVVLQCLVRNAKPAAEIVWFKRNAELKTGKENLNKFNFSYFFLNDLFWDAIGIQLTKPTKVID